MSKTPRTDAETKGYFRRIPIRASFARELETELGEWQCKAFEAETACLEWKQRYENLLEETQTKEKWYGRSNQFR